MELPLHRDQTEVIKVSLAGFAALLPALFWLWHRHLEPRADALARRSRRALQLALAGLMLASVANYSRLSPSYVYGERVDTYDLIHYYLNARYFDELGYFNLVPAVVLADLELGVWKPRRMDIFQAQSEEDYYFVKYSDFDHDTAWHARIREPFGEAGWMQFKHDFRVLQREMRGLTKETWPQLQVDHGFNGAPSWVLLAQPLAEVVPVEWVKLLGYIDLVWLIAAVGVTAWAFGLTPAMWVVVFLLTTYSTRWPTITWAFGRYDYVSLLIIAVGLLKKGRPLGAGVAAGISAAFRIFPAVWLWGPGFKGVYELVAERQVNRRLLRLAVGFFGVIALLNLGVVARYGSVTVTRHMENLFAHTTPENLSSMRQGFAIAYAYQGETDIRRMDPERRQRVKDQKTPRTALAVGLVLLLGWALRRKPDYEGFAFGFIPFFLLATASYYYYVVRATLVVVHAGELSKLRNAVGLSLLFFIEALINGLQQHPATKELRVIHMGWMGWTLALYAGVMIGWLLWEGRAEAAEDAE